MAIVNYLLGFYLAQVLYPNRLINPAAGTLFLVVRYEPQPTAWMMCEGIRQARAALARTMTLLRAITTETPVITAPRQVLFGSVTPEPIGNFAQAVIQDSNLQEHLRVRAQVVRFVLCCAKVVVGSVLRHERGGDGGGDGGGNRGGDSGGGSQRINNMGSSSY